MGVHMVRRCPVCASLYHVNGVVFDAGRQVLRWPGGMVRLARLHTRLLAALIDRPAAVVPPERLIDALWGDGPDGAPDDADANLSVQAHYLRRRLRQAGFPGRIVTSHGVGYELVQ